jgi:3-hydroxyacyl-[acyl-carrier-protein] dehydratase
MRFSLVDRITSLEADKSITAVKNLTMAEEYLADHFPGFPVMPGVLMLETMVQASAWLMRYTENFEYSTILLKQARALRFNNFVTPGKTLIVTSTVHKKSDREWIFKAAGTVDGNSAVSAKLTIERFNLSENNEKMAKSDDLRIKAMKDMFDQIWTPPEA